MPPNERQGTNVHACASRRPTAGLGHPDRGLPSDSEVY